MKNKLIGLLIGLLVISAGVLTTYVKLYQKEKQEKERFESNFQSSLSDIQEYKTKQGELVAVINGYELKDKEFKQLLPQLYSEIRELKIRLKNALSATKVITEIKYINKDSIIYVPLTDSTRKFVLDEKWLKAEVTVTDFKYIAPGAFKINDIPNETLIVAQGEYKGWWFWRKAVGVNIHIKHTNPYIKTIGGEYIDLKK